MIQSIIPYLFLLTGFSSPVAGSLESQDLSYLYKRNSEMEIRSKVLYDRESPRLLLEVIMKRDVYEMTDYTVFQEYVKSYDDKVGSLSDTLKILDHIIKRTRNGFYFSINLQPNPDHQLYVLHFANMHNQKHYYYGVSLNSTKKDRFIFFDAEGLPYLKPWISPENEVRFSESESRLFGYFYSVSFGAADPPMQLESTGSPSLKIDSVFSISPGSLPTFEREGLYFIQSDTLSLQGYAFRVQNSYFPKLAKLEDIVNSLRYFSSRSEWEMLHQAEKKKEAFDNYWLNILRSPETAKNVIKNYFDQVELANRYFTNYKEGWKTDMGMIYIIMGSPDEVYRNESSEEWVYSKSEDLPRLKFQFTKRSSIFTDQHYVLERNSNFRDEWYKAVELWRKGRFENLLR